MFDKCKKLVTWLILSMLLAGCGSVATVIPVPATATSIPPTDTPSPTPLPPTVTPSPTPFPGNQVTFQTEDGIQIAGTMYGAGEIAVILAHQGTPDADQTSWQPFVPQLVENGFTVLTFDFRGRGDSQGTLVTGKLIYDLQAALQFLRERGYEKIICVGASMGGTTCMRATLDGDILGLVVLASTFNIGKPTAVTSGEMAGLTIPKLFIVADKDNLSVVLETRQMYDRSPEPKQFINYPDLHEHGTDLFKTSVGDDLKNSILQFLVAVRDGQ
jgi:alpha/beta superfamily hydrolase